MSPGPDVACESEAEEGSAAVLCLRACGSTRSCSVTRMQGQGRK